MNRKQRKGFTLVELMIVVAIILILASIGVSSYTHYTKLARRAKCVSNLRVIHEAKMAWAVDNPKADAIPELADLAKGGYFRGKTDGSVVPECPSGGEYTYETAPADVAVKPTCSYEGAETDDVHVLK